MFLWLRNNKAGLPYLLLRIHDLLVRDTIKYFEKGGPVRRKNRQVRKALNKAMGIARKNKRNPGVMLGTAVNAVRELSEEVERTRKALRATYDSMEEALRQIEKHAQATEVEARREFGAGRTEVSVSDNGKGFVVGDDLTELPRAGKLGLAGMAERVRLLAGNMKIESRPGKGTRVMITVPI